MCNKQLLLFLIFFPMDDEPREFVSAEPCYFLVHVLLKKAQETNSHYEGILSALVQNAV